MPESHKLLRMAAERGIPLDKIVEDAFQRHRTIAAVAKDLGVTRGAIYWWLKQKEKKQHES